eukprot:gnl/Chilomastix_caulleri/556.p2 GENE.gnl/Chilomastix_caulleri/556~~gnl/Chilomastix_caulleri/556.p2  ORF type:complete len:147 (+),score=8.73 gnl/Chilomastix_caulleri/556:63-503(+)
MQDEKTGEMHVEIIGYTIRDPKTHKPFVSLDKGKLVAGKIEMLKDSAGQRVIKYTLPKSFLDQKSVSTVITICSGSTVVKNLKIIEEHVICGEVMQTFEFSTPLVIPGSVSEWETLYVPNKKLTSKEVKKAVITKETEWLVHTKII